MLAMVMSSQKRREKSLIKGMAGYLEDLTVVKLNLVPASLAQREADDINLNLLIAYTFINTPTNMEVYTKGIWNLHFTLN